MFDPLKAKGKVLVYTTLAFLFGMGMASGMGWTGSGHAMPTVSQQPQVSAEAVQPALDLSDAFVNVAQTVTPAVVRIEVERPRRRSARGGNVPEELRRFFNFPDEGERPDAPDIQLSGGSGFIVSEDGYVLTNNHVVADAERIQVFLPDRRRFDAELVGQDPTTDVAVVKITSEADFPTLSFGNSDDLRVGEWVLAVGNPGFGGPSSSLDYTVTAGIVSAKGRPLQLLRRELLQDPNQDQQMAQFAIEDFIQTDAVINPGNSGGPMVNLRGQVVGINSAISSVTGFYQGYGFAIPIDLAQRIMEDLIEFGKVRRPWLGVAIQDVDEVDAEVYDLPEVSGVLVSDLPEDGPAAAAGIRSEDVIVSIDGTQVERVNQLQNLVARHRPGDRVRVGVIRDGERRDIQVRLGEAPISAAAEPEPETEVEAEERLGMQVMDMTPDLAREIGFERAEGPVITNVVPLGPAARQGVFPGRRILEINGETVEDADDVKDILEDLAPGSIVTFRLELPGGQREIVNVRVPR